MYWYFGTAIKNYQRKFFLLTGQNKYKETCSSIITTKTGRKCLTSYVTQIGCTQKQWHFNHQPFLIGKLFDAQAEEFGMPMFNLLKVIETPDVLGALSHGLDTISFTEITKLKDMIKDKKELSGLDVHIMDMEAQNICRRQRQCASQGGQTPSKQH